jgi:hypothetical protein
MIMQHDIKDKIESLKRDFANFCTDINAILSKVFISSFFVLLFVFAFVIF